VRACGVSPQFRAVQRRERLAGWCVHAGGGSKQDRVDNAQTMTNYYYDLATDFYEYGWCGAVARLCSCPS
jgi:hypothetical protein